MTYADLEAASAVLLVGFEPEEESPIVFLRLRKAVRSTGTKVVSIAPWATRGLSKLSGRLVAAAPGTEAEVLPPWPRGGPRSRTSATCCRAAARSSWSASGSPPRPAGCPQPRRWPTATGARLAWVPRRAGERGALEAGALPTLLPGGRPVADAAARVDVQTAWGDDRHPGHAGPRHRRHPGRRRGRRARRAGRRRRRPGRPARPAGRARGDRGGRLRRQPRDPAQRR